VFQWVHKKCVLDPTAMSDLPATLRDRLVADGLASPLEIASVRRSLDDTRKVLVKLHDGATVETVLIPAVSGPGSTGRASESAEYELDADTATMDDVDEEPDAAAENKPLRRVTQCISTQVGCAMGCVFCASGVAGLKRHLTAEEIVAQVIHGRAMLDEGEGLTNVVFMGMGEPLHNYEATARALSLFIRQDGLSLSSRRVTVSTSGLVPEIARLGREFSGQITLAISLHATTDERRSALMPINKKYPLAVLMKALRDYPLAKRRRITIEFTLVAGQNDSLDEARRLVDLLRGIPVKINLIPMNPIEASVLGPPNLAGVLAFQRVLLDAGYSCFVRRRRGDDVDAACGQLALLGAAPRKRRAFAADEH
jgi:23S rRNA (adenine2503-C2)-methyltransferase